MRSGTNQKKHLDVQEPDQKGTSFMIKLANVCSFIQKELIGDLYDMDEDELHYWSCNLPRLKERIKDALVVDDPYLKEKQYWMKFYQRYFSLNTNFSNIIIAPKPVEGAWRLLIIAQRLTLMQVYKAWNFSKWKYIDNLDEVVTTNIRDTKTAYALWVRDGLEPDEKYLGKSTNQADPKMAIGVTLLERMIHEMAFLDESGRHLDDRGTTFCGGSRDSDNKVPGMYWHFSHQQVQVIAYTPDFSKLRYGIREAVAA